ncbi:respiratory chain complex I subunit 1 family protein [Thiolapillus brandeum]|uniref:Formate hydrogenlyase membrane subunit HyfD n=1 Tax=Thiolapillus brandeum TaxID=1076588 RepID=A0A7U6GGZ6_9GAMM|nr:NADH-quinone oxidoreductase subunit H [Thiolapillus brandeum]BAO43475.1 formate hydrogenlyase membrane subunit HyfD [Thiolapillus brandeum]
MADFLSLSGWFIVVLQGFLFLLGAPLLTGWIRFIKSRLQNRKGPPIVQPLQDLRKLFGKEALVAHTASMVFRAAPYVVFTSALVAVSLVPLIATNLPSAMAADMIVLVGLLALGRFFLALAGMDVGSSFGGMGASREMLVSALAEPAMLMAVFTLAMSAHSTNLSSVVDFNLSNGLILRPSFLFALLGLMLVAVAETGRIPVDNPATHLELTMIHEAMILEYSGRHLALMEWAAQLKLMLYGVLIVNLFFPWGIATADTAAALFLGLLAVVLKLLLLGVVVAVGETVLAKMRLFRVPQYLNLAFLLTLLGLFSHIILETGV